MKTRTRGEVAKAREEGKSEPTNEAVERTFAEWQTGIELQF